MREKIKLLKLFDWKLFISLSLLSLVPAIIQTIETFIISSSVSTEGIDVIGQIEWFDLISETICAFLIIPLYSIFNKILKNDKEMFPKLVFKAIIIVFILYTIFSIVVLIYAKNLVSFMNPNETDLSLINRYLSITTISFMIGIIVNFINVILVVIDKSKNIYILLISKALITVVSDFIIIPRMGVMGVAFSSILINIILSLFGILILIKEKAIKPEFFKKTDVKIIKDWVKVGAFSGIQQFISNIVYALMICKMVNMVAEQGNYWVANNFIWGWLLIPISAISEVVRKDCKNGYEELKQSNYYIIVTTIVLLWIITIPLWSLFFEKIELLVNYREIFNIVILLFPFYIFYAFQQIPDSIFIGVGKTKYNFISTCIVNFIYYGIWYMLYKNSIITFTMNIIIFMFGFGMVTSLMISIIEEKVFLKKEIIGLHINEKQLEEGVIKKIINI